ncbi:RNA polymerase sigma-70 factor [Filimonas effusa]|uniref:RNA polymerase sigma-70 factor n=1 Tax=Filimonas effusa TaxID=2508721 RepID=A0A4Q1CZI7_9BACT|nr:RNA polymerase sigma-70 factor [Filimonas effusa]RXK80820.1 RNA polymerase sigma-70 factor [Filimonas effusa]
MLDCLKTIQIAISNGDEQAFAKLYQQFHKRLWSFCKSIIRSSESAEEIVEDVFVKLWCNRANLVNIEDLTVYLYVAVKNRALNTLSKKAQELVTSPFDFLEIELDGNVTPYDVLINAEMVGCMRKAIDELPPRCKMIFKLIREDGLKYKEVADILNISVNTIDAQMAIAVKRICLALKIPKPQLVFVPQKKS